MDIFIVLHFLFWSRRAVCLNLPVAPERMWFYCKCPGMTTSPSVSPSAVLKEVAERMIYSAVKMG